MHMTSKALLITGPQHAKLLVNNTLDTMSGMLAITADDLYFEEFRNAFDDFFNIKADVPLKAFKYSIASDIASIGVITLSDKEFHRTHPNYKCSNAVNIFKKPKACISITLKTQQQIVICPIPINENIRQEEYASCLVKLIQNAKAEKTPNTSVFCKCCGRALSYPQNFCELCGTPIHIVRRLAGADGVERKVKITLASGKSAAFKTDRGHDFNLISMQSVVSKPVTTMELKYCSPRMVLFISTPYQVKRLEISLAGNGELQVDVDGTGSKILAIHCAGNIWVTREDLAAPAFLYYGDMALKPAKPYGERDNVLLVDP